jgi:hypothetical protein
VLIDDCRHVTLHIAGSENHLKFCDLIRTPICERSMMRRFHPHVLGATLTLFLFSLLFTAACEQRPIDVFPESYHTSWQPFGPEEPDKYTSIAGTSASNIYAATYRKLMHFDGNQWSEIEVPGGSGGRDLWIASENELYVLQSRSLIMYDGTDWTMVYEQERCCLQNIWGLSADDLYITAGNIVLHYDGTSWSADTLAENSWNLSLSSIWGTSDSDIYAAGQIDHSNEVIYHNDGSGWTMMLYGNFGRLNSLWGSGADDMYAAGLTRLLHYNGDTWSEVSLPQSVWRLNEVWGTERNDVWVFYGSSGYGTLSPIGMFHFDGTEWQIVDGPTNMALFAAWGASADDIFAVGDAAKMVRYDGSKWYSLSGGWPSDPVCIWGFDDDNFFLANPNSIYRYSAGEFTEFTDVCGLLETWDLWGTSLSFLVSVGLEGKIFIYNGTTWTRASIPATSNFTAVAGVANDAVWAVGLDGMCFFYNGGEWIQLFERAGMTLWDVWPASEKCAFAVGNEGAIVRFDGSTPTVFTTGISEDLHSVWGTSTSNVFAAGESGVILHFDGKKWMPMIVPNACTGDAAFVRAEGWNTLVSISGKDNQNVTAVDMGGCLLHYNGVVWNGVSVDNSMSVHDVWMSPGGRIFISTWNDLYVAAPEW